MAKGLPALKELEKSMFICMIGMQHKDVIPKKRHKKVAMKNMDTSLAREI